MKKRGTLALFVDAVAYQGHFDQESRVDLTLFLTSHYYTV